MTYNIDPNKMKQTIDNMFGNGAYENRMSMISNIAKLSTQKDLMQQQYDAAQKAAQNTTSTTSSSGTSSGSSTSSKSTKKSYVDAVDELAGHISNVNDAVKLANEIRNDPTQQADLKSQGYTLTDYINALYNAASNGKYRSEREYNQAQKSSSDPTNLLIQNATKSATKNQPKKSGLSALLSTIEKNVKRPVKSLTSGMNDLLNQEKAHIDEAKQTGKSKGGISVNLGELGNAFKQGWNGQNSVSGADLLKTAGSNNKTVNNLAGGAIDFAVNPLNAVALGALGKGIESAGLVPKAEAGITSLGLGKNAANIGANALKGAGMMGGLTAAGNAYDAVANPGSESIGQRLANIGVNSALGAIGEGASAGIGRFLSSISKSSPESQTLGLPEPKEQTLALPEPQKALPEPARGLPEPLQGNQLLETDKSIPGVKAIKGSNPYPAKFEQLVNDFNQLQSEGKVTPGREYEVAKDMWSQMAGPKDPSFEDLLKLANDNTQKTYTPQEQLDLVKQARKNQNAGVYGVQNIVNSLPKNQPGTMRTLLQYVGKIKNPIATRVQKVGQSIDNVAKAVESMPKQPEQSSGYKLDLQYFATLQKMMNAKAKELGFKNVSEMRKASPQLADKYEKSFANQIRSAQAKVGSKKNVEKAINSSPEPSPQPKKMTKSEKIQERNKEQFVQNNDDTPIPDTSSHIVSKKDLKPSIKASKDLLYTKTVDNLYPLSKFDKEVEKVTGGSLKPSEKTHVLALNSRGSDQISKQILTQKMVDSKNKVIGQSLKDITKGLDSKQLKEFEDYLVNKHAVTRMERGEKVYSDEMKMSPEKSQKKVQEYEKQHPEFKQLAKEYYNYNKQLGKSWLVDTGILSKDEWNAYLERNPYYVPNNRAFNPLEKSMNQNSKSGFANQSNPVKKATGSQRKIISPLESTIEHTAKYVKTAKRNEVMQTLIKNIQKDPESLKDWAEIVKTDKTPQSILETLDKEGVDGVLNELNKGFDQKPDLTNGNIVTGIVDGHKVHVRVRDPQLLDAITNLSPPEQNIVFKFFGKATRIMKTLTTGVNPVFSLTRNIFRDVPQSYVNSTTTKNPISFSKDLISAFIDVVGNREAYKSFKNFGGGHSSPISSDVNLLAQSKRSVLKQKGIKPLLGKGLGALENLNNAIESAPRLAEYKRNIKPGDYDSQVKALYEANDITTNFNKYGNFTKGLDSMIPYLNAAVQGLDKMVRQFKNEPKSTIAKATAAIALPTIVLYAVNHNNKNYQQLSNYVKDNNFLIPLPNGTFYKIAKPRELGMLFSTDIERTLRAWANQDPHAFQGFANTLLTNFAPSLRSIVAPINDLNANKNFMGVPIVSADLQNLSPRYQYDSQTSSISKGLGNLLNKSPKKIDYLIKSYGGVLGQLGIPATSEGSTVGSTLKNQVIADPVFSNDIMTNFYNEQSKLDTAHNDLTKMGVKSPDLNEPLRKTFDSQANNISKVRKQLKAVQNSKSLSKQQKNDQIRQLTILMNNLAQQTNKLVR